MSRGGKPAARRRRGTSRKRRKGRRASIWLLAGIGLLVAGFVVRRTLVPRMTHYLAYRPPDRSAAAPGAIGATRRAGAPLADEHLTPGDRRQLDRVIRQNSK